MSANIEERIELDFLRPPLTFTFSDGGLKRGIRTFFSRVEGHRPYIRIGGRKITFDRKRPPVFHREDDGSWVRRAEVHLVTPKNGAPSFYVLRSINDGANSALVYVNTWCPDADNDHTHAWRGLSHEEYVVQAERDHMLLSMVEGDSVIVFFCEHASKLTFNNGELTEETLTAEEDAWERARSVAFELSQPWYGSLPATTRNNLQTLFKELKIETV